MLHKNIRKNISIPEGKSHQVLLNKIYNLQQIHITGCTCYDKSDEWKMCAYGWHNPLFPPEYRQCCLTGEHFEAEPSCDLYYFMAQYYESLTCHKAPYNFELDHSWKHCIMSHSTIQNPIIQSSISDIIAYCTKWQRKKRIQNAEDLINTEPIKNLKKQLFFQD